MTNGAISFRSCGSATGAWRWCSQKRVIRARSLPSTIQHLNPIAEDIQLPDYTMAPGGLYSRDDRLYMLVEPSDDQANPSVAVYTLRRSLDAL